MQEMRSDETIIHFTEADSEKAFQLAKQRRLPVLVDYWAPGCKGCKKMELTTYQSSEILSYIDSSFVFIKCDVTNRSVPKIQSSPILWTPTFIVFSNDGSEVRKTIGYLNEQQFKTDLELGRAMAFLRKAQAQTALEILENFIANADNENSLPEAIYWAGVASYFQNHRNAESLVPHWQQLMAKYPDNTWAQKADCLAIKL